MQSKLAWLFTGITMLSITAYQAQNRNALPQGFKEQKTSGISFTENKGQVHDQNYKPRPDVLFGAMAGNMAVYIKNTGVSYQLYRADNYKEVVDERTKEKRKEIDQQTIYRIDLNWLNANTNFTKSTDATLPGYNNYYTEGCPEGGALNVKSYTGITLNNLYNGINLHYYEKNNNLKHDYIVAPHANYKQIQLQVNGAEISINNDGSLLLTTPLGKVQEGAPIVYQNNKQLKAKWVLSHTERSRSVNEEKSCTLSFEIENYNPNLELIIDPLTRLWGTYYGGSGSGGDFGYSCSTDASGNVYLAGTTISNSGTVIATTGAHQSAYGGGSYDAFLVKFNTSGVRQWGSYYGGSGVDEGRSCSTDASGNVYLAGYTNSTTGTVIATTGAHQSAIGGGYDAFLVKFNTSGIRQWSTYYGGSTGNDRGYSCSTDASGNVYLAGYTQSNTGTFIATAGAHQSAPGGGGSFDAFLVKFNASGVRQWGTYYGGSGYEEGRSCSTDASGNVYLAGRADSNTGTVIATTGAHQSAYGGSTDAFLVKFNASGVRQWGTYYGGSGNDYGNSCSTDASGNVYLAGYTNSNTGTGIATTGAHQSAYGGGVYDAFLVKFNTSGVRQWGTYYGGSGYEEGYSCSTDASGNVYLAGYTPSNTGTVIATTGAHQSAYGGGSYDAFLVKFNTSGVRQWGSYYGGSGGDGGYSCSTDASGNVYLAGYTDSNSGTVIATAGAHQSAIGGGYDAFLVKFFDCDVSALPTVSVASSNTSFICVGSSATLTATGASTYVWNTTATTAIIVVSPNTTTSYTVTGTGANGCTANAVISQSVSTCTGLNSNFSNLTSNFIVYPNPTNSVINIEFLVFNNESYTIEIVNIVGQVLHKETVTTKNLTLKTDNLQNGVYFVKATVDGKTKTVKLVKE